MFLNQENTGSMQKLIGIGNEPSPTSMASSKIAASVLGDLDYAAGRLIPSTNPVVMEGERGQMIASRMRS